MVFFFKQKTAYEMRISDWSSDVCSSDLPVRGRYAGQDFDRLAFVAADADLAHRDPAVLADDRDHRAVRNGYDAASRKSERTRSGPERDREAGEDARLETELRVAYRALKSGESLVGQVGVSTCRSLWRPC